MTNKEPFCTSLRLIRAVLGQLLKKAISMALWTKVITCDKAGFKSRFCQVHQAGKIGVNQRNLCPRYPRLINDLCLYICRASSTNVMSALQIELFLQNKAKFRKVKLNVTKVLVMDYEQMDTWSIRKKQSQTNPNKAKTNPILANKTPIRTQFKPNLSCRSLWRSRNKTNLTLTYLCRLKFETLSAIIPPVNGLIGPLLWKCRTPDAQSSITDVCKFFLVRCFSNKLEAKSKGLHGWLFS